jgi:serine/threonine protein kinase/WD40 repeat protein
MPNQDSSRDYDLLDRLVEEFNDRFRRGERPSVHDYCLKHPELADDLRDLLPAVARVEGAKDVLAEVGPPAKPKVGEMGDFHIFREIGHGGMGVVFEAQQVSLGRRVALKVLTHHLMRDDKQRRRFEREAKAAARLHHTNIVPVHGYGEHDGTPYYVMQFIHGMGLDAVIEELARMAPAATHAPGSPPAPSRVDNRAASIITRSLLTGVFRPPTDELGEDPADPTRTAAAGLVDPPPAVVVLNSSDPPGRRPADTSGVTSSVTLPGQSATTAGGKARALTYWQSVARVGVQVADALAYAHTQGVVHRDVKPSNLLLDLNGTVWVTDFGLAKADDSDNLTRTGDVLGTLRYMPPEAFEGKADALGDVYALGLTLYELVALRPAYDERDRNRLIKQVTNSEPTPLGRARRGVPRDLETVITKAIDRDPARRYATAADFRDDLQRFVDDEPIKARRQSQWESAHRWARHHPGIATLAAVLAALLVLVTAGSLIVAGLMSDLARKEAQAAADERSARREAVEAGRRETDARRAAEGASELARRQVARLHVNNGNAYLTGPDLGPALLWYGRAWYSDVAAGADDTNHRLRIGRSLQSQPQLIGLAVHDAAVSEAVIDGSGKVAVTLTVSGAAYLCELATGRKTLLPHPSPVTAVAFRPAGDYAVTAATDGTAVVWDATAGKKLHTLNHGEPVSHVALVAKGSLVSTTSGKVGVRLWDVTTGKRAGTALAVPGAYYATFDPDGGKLLTADSAGFARVWDTLTGEPLGTPRPHGPRTKRESELGYRRGPVFTPDGNRVVTSDAVKGSTDPNEYEQWLWPAAGEGGPLWGPVPVNHGRGYAFSPDGKYLLAAGSSNGLFDLATGEKLATVTAPRETQVVCFAGDTAFFVGSTGGLLQQYVIRPNPEAKAVSVVPGRVWGHAAENFTYLGGVPGRGLFAAGSDGTARLYADPDSWSKTSYSMDCGRAHRLRTFGDGPERIAYSPDGLVECRYGPHGPPRVGRRGVGEWPVTLATDGPVTAVRFSAGGEILYTSDGQSLRCWRPATGAPVGPAIALPGGGVTAASSHDGTSIAVYSRADKLVRVYDTATGAPRLTFPFDAMPHAESATSVNCRFSPDDKLLAIADDHFPAHLEVWDIPAGDRLYRARPHRGYIADLAFSPDSTKLLLGSSDTTARLFDARTGEPAGPPLRAASFVRSVAMAPDGRRAATADRRGNVQLWDAMTGEAIGRWNLGGDWIPIWFSRDGRRVIADRQGGKVLELTPLTLPAGRLSAVLDLLTGRRIDPATDGIEYLPGDTFVRDPDGYLAAWREWRGPSVADVALGKKK